MSINVVSLRRPNRGWTALPAAALAGTLLASLAAVAVTLLARRAVGALEQPLSTLGMLVAGCALAALAWAVRLLVPELWPERPAYLTERVLKFALPALVVAAAAALCLPGASVSGVAALWAVVLAGEAASLLGVPKRAAQALVEASRAPRRFALRAGAPGARLLQQLARERLADGSEAIYGRLRVTLAAQQRTAAAHVAFCPPFERMPRCEILGTRGARSRVRVVQLFTYGARFEVKRHSASSIEQSVTLDFRAIEDPRAGSDSK